MSAASPEITTSLWIGTTTHQKVLEYAAIASAYGELADRYSGFAAQYAHRAAHPPLDSAGQMSIAAGYNTLAAYFGKRIDIRPLNDIDEHHSAPEYGDTSEENVLEKSADIAEAVKKFRKGGKYHRAFMNELMDNDISFVGGPETAMQRTYFMADDTTEAVPEDIWNKMLPVLEKLVTPDAIKFEPWKPDDEPGINFISITSVGKVMAALTQRGFWGLILEKANEIPYYRDNPVSVYHRIKCTVKCLNDPLDAPFIRLEAYTERHVFAPPPGYRPKSPIETSDDYTCEPFMPHLPISAKYRKYLLEDSTRKKILDQFLELVNKNEAKITKTNDVQKSFSAASKDISSNKRRKIVQLSGDVFHDGKAQGSIDGHKIAKVSFHKKSNGYSNGKGLKWKEFIDALSMEFPIGKGNSVTHADALLLPSFDASNYELRARNTLMFLSASVAKALDRRYHNVPLIVMNHNGCWNDALILHFLYAKRGFNKAFVLDPLHDQLKPGEKIVTTPNVKHISSLYADFIISKGDDASAAVQAAKEALRFRFKNYRRVGTKKLGSHHGGTQRPIGSFAATVFASATSNRKDICDNGVAIGRMLGEFGIALCTGGGDQNALYTPIIGYNQTRRKGSHITCVSTHDIVKVETKEGFLPPCDYWELHDKIGARLETLIKSDIYVSIGGGDGTGQETALVLYMMKFMPKEMRGKKMIFVGTDPSMYAEIRSIVGKKEFRKLLQDGRRKEPKGVDGIFLVPDAEAAKDIIAKAQAEFYARDQVRRTVLDVVQRIGDAACTYP